MELPRDYWEAYEVSADTLDAYIARASKLVATWMDKTFVWRGMADADWALHSSLYRQAKSVVGKELLEGTPSKQGPASLRHWEAAIVEEARGWGLQRTATDRLSALELLAALQHQGVPTRLLDFTHNAVIALWFAVERQVAKDGTRLPDTDGRVFVVEARPVPHEWPRDPELPWKDPPADWLQNIYVWTPPPIDPRMTRQQGCFVIGGVPSTEGRWNAKEGGKPRALTAREVRSCVSAPVRLNNPRYLEQAKAPGRKPGYPLAWTIRVPKEAKPDLRRDLVRALGYRHSMLYPDYPGFADFGLSIPRAAS